MRLPYFHLAREYARDFELKRNREIVDVYKFEEQVHVTAMNIYWNAVLLALAVLAFIIIAMVKI